MPNIRYVCTKVAIDHSTFYRWMEKYHSFYKAVLKALDMGRDRMNDAAEGVIISGIQRNEFKHASYWLSHNSPRYSSSEQLRYLRSINNNLIEIMKEETPKDSSEATFEIYFDAYESMIKVFGKETADDRIDKLVRLACYGDPELEKIFYASYAEWKTNKDEIKRRTEEASPSS